MSNSIPKKKSNALKKFRRLKTMTIQEVAECLGSSIITARRQLKQWQTHTSYNKNGRYYVLPEVVNFDHQGLWHHNDVLFSRYGNLKDTVIQLVSRSESGLEAIEIGAQVKLLSRSFLSHFRDTPRLYREKIEGQFVYFSSDEPLLLKQKKKREEQNARNRDIRFPTHVEAIMILVERIKHPELSMKKFCNLLRAQGCVMSAEEVIHFFEHHGIEKKTPVTSSSKG